MRTLWAAWPASGGREKAGERGAGWFLRGWSTGRPSKQEVRSSSLGEILSHCSSTVGLDEQRWSMVLELYYRKTERKREGKREGLAMATWREGEKGGGKGELEMRVRKVRA